jgi:hypothetical protein
MFSLYWLFAWNINFNATLCNSKVVAAAVFAMPIMHLSIIQVLWRRLANIAVFEKGTAMLSSALPCSVNMYLNKH